MRARGVVKAGARQKVRRRARYPFRDQTRAKARQSDTAEEGAHHDQQEYLFRILISFACTLFQSPFSDENT